MLYKLFHIYTNLYCDRHNIGKNILGAGTAQSVLRRGTGWTAGMRDYSVFIRVQIGSRAQPISYPMGAGSPILENKVQRTNSKESASN
jgi:hypothetical protein